MKTYRHPITKQAMTKKDYFELMFGKEFMDSNDKGSLKEYDEKSQLIYKIQTNYMIKEMWNKDEIQNIPNLSLKDLREVSQEIDEINAEAIRVLTLE
tara:strand:+ start:1268 stop:1558 length:291 start_codon:yes stop_codon:yes gene_type:complete